MRESQREGVVYATPFFTQNVSFLELGLPILGATVETALQHCTRGDDEPCCLWLKT